MRREDPTKPAARPSLWPCLPTAPPKVVFYVWWSNQPKNKIITFGSDRVIQTWSASKKTLRLSNGRGSEVRAIAQRALNAIDFFRNHQSVVGAQNANAFLKAGWLYEGMTTHRVYTGDGGFAERVTYHLCRPSFLSRFTKNVSHVVRKIPFVIHGAGCFHPKVNPTVT